MLINISELCKQTETDKTQRLNFYLLKKVTRYLKALHLVSYTPQPMQTPICYKPVKNPHVYLLPPVSFRQGQRKYLE